MYIGYQNGKITYYTDHIVEAEFDNGSMIETNDEYVMAPSGQEYVLKSDYDEAVRQYNLARVMKYRMTKLDFFKYVLAPAGITYAQLQEVLKTNDMMSAAWDLCNHVYRGDTTLNQFIFAQVPTLTEEVLNNLFLMYGEYDESASL